MKKLFTIACPVILATLGVALLFIIRKKRKEKRLKRLRGEAGLGAAVHGTGPPSSALLSCLITPNSSLKPSRFCVSCTDAKSLAEMLIRWVSKLQAVGRGCGSWGSRVLLSPVSALTWAQT